MDDEEVLYDDGWMGFLKKKNIKNKKLSIKQKNSSSVQWAPGSELAPGLPLTDPSRKKSERGCTVWYGTKVVCKRTEETEATDRKRWLLH